MAHISLFSFIMDVRKLCLEFPSVFGMSVYLSILCHVILVLITVGLTSTDLSWEKTSAFLWRGDTSSPYTIDIVRENDGFDHLMPAHSWQPDRRSGKLTTLILVYLIFNAETWLSVFWTIIYSYIWWCIGWREATKARGFGFEWIRQRNVAG